MALYEVRIKGKKDNRSVIFAGTGLRGLALSNSSVDADGEITAIVAQPTNPSYLGNLSRNVTATGLPTATELLFKESGMAERLEDPDKSGGKVSLEDVEEFAVEGAALGVVNPIQASSVKGQRVTFKDGLPVIAAVGDYAFFEILGFEDAVEGNPLRVILKRCEAHVVVASES